MIADSELVRPRGTGPRPPADPAPAPDRLKAAGDFTLTLVLGVLAAPVIAAAAVLVKLTSRGPAFYTQTRVGMNGRHYKIIKIRTMTYDCERTTGAQWATAGDPRVTRVGRFLRKTHLDELPQLWNVLRGEMSLVGPRPERPEFVATLARAIPNYRKRLAVRPGVTGLAQVQLPADTDVDSVRLKLVYDLYYIRHRTWGMDLRLALATAVKMLHLPFGVSRVVLRIPSADVVESGPAAWAADAPAPVPGPAG